MKRKLTIVAVAALLAPGAAMAEEEACKIAVLQADGMATITGLAHGAQWNSGRYSMSVTVQNGTNRSVSRQGGTIASDADGAATLARSVVSLPPGSEAEIVLELRNGAAETRCFSRLAG
ncbi:hypothetical protein OG2516_18185 [Oceanicola granulosus HTCC2516]|uniref:CsgH-like domain-containing protein n=1 Tax=Oceanicola granulosus (strain ATCC BAA-861 / DSM 15982 / KCTC 12143 / HTCC2516) TaxID=314256 RepID=Q2CEK7_OCEGH|nr:curli-like amyloid fiber formation chaperone CsgH [Oceanicola granulosus]EAR51125.1 hypothetical protein OG2516_18185 [Oceanicola granulosus HTCC2516]